MYETVYYKGQIHYKTKEKYKENNYYDWYGRLTSQEVITEDYQIGKLYNPDDTGNNLNYDEYDIETQLGIKSNFFYYNDENELIEAEIDGETYYITYSTLGQPDLYLGWNITYDMRSIKTLSKNGYNIFYVQIPTSN